MTDRERRNLRVANRSADGLCACGTAAERGASQCLACKLARADALEARRTAKLERGECRECSLPSMPGRLRCRDHLRLDLVGHSALAVSP